MARNQKYRPTAVRLGPAIKAALLCIFFAGAGVGYIWQKTQIQHLAEQIRRSESRLDQLNRQNDSLTRAVATLCTASELDERVKKMNLGLVQPQLSQIVRLRDSADPGVPSIPTNEPRTHETVQLYASRR